VCFWRWCLRHVFLLPNSTLSSTTPNGVSSKGRLDISEVGMDPHPWFSLSPSAFPASGRAPSKRGVDSTTSSGGMGSAAVAPKSLNLRIPGRSLVSKDPTALLKALTAAVKAPRKDSR